ncbi:MAG: hypothetical protein P4L87_25240 [Formivibrio sp.]|nr:hypothetical protein [Formivibrio sp.]
MAIVTPLNYRGIDLPAAYIRVNRVFGGKREGWNSVVGIYANQAAAADQAPLEEFNQAAAYSPDNLNAIDLVYLALKVTYPAATDC